ncbi:MAG: regulator of protease activity HflC (stomatin/prohibitin superfamily), partial [Roseivirga sp.]
MENQDINMLIDKLKKGPWKIFAIVIVVLVLLGSFKPWAQVGAGERGIVMNFGAVQDKVLNEGIHPIVPVMQKVILMDVRIHKVETDAVSASSDLQDVALSVALNYHILPEKANVVYQTIGVEFKDRI